MQSAKSRQWESLKDQTARVHQQSTTGKKGEKQPVD